ncbi:unnamed protein product [Caenorhabditis auriculariae]|uniref:Uncharacterized protein n=1 Tax=Caenorhabditis auriculariae TaxID=2777116 RepID=A0A8S1GSU6_9PELO|nr:unnamed protein product [Caenorhabditis auriculariae]
MMRPSRPRAFLLLSLLLLLQLAAAQFLSEDELSDETQWRRERRSGLLFGKLARIWGSNDKRFVLRPMPDYK